MEVDVSPGWVRWGDEGGCVHCVGGVGKQRLPALAIK